MASFALPLLLLSSLLYDGETTFKKAILDTRFVSESTAVGDVNRDGKLDILAGNAWYEAPDWKPRQIAPYVQLDPKTQYSNCFNSWAADLNKDGWVDQIVIGMPGEKAIWRENPKGAPGPWKEHFIWRGAGNESPMYEDLFGNGKKVLVMAYDDNYLAWFEPSKDPYAEWVCHNVSDLKGAGSHRYSHGLGIGDLDGDGRKEIVTKNGYYTAPKDRTQPWIFVKADFGPDCAHMLFVGEGRGKKARLLTTSAHARGVWLFRPTDTGGYERIELDKKFSQTHSANLMPLGKVKTPNLVTGKRKWAHPPGVDVGSDEDSVLVRYELTDTAEFQIWISHVIDDSSGVGTQFVVQDMNRDKLLDIVTANKNGVFLFTQNAKR